MMDKLSGRQLFRLNTFPFAFLSISLAMQCVVPCSVWASVGPRTSEYRVRLDLSRLVVPTKHWLRLVVLQTASTIQYWQGSMLIQGREFEEGLWFEDKTRRTWCEWRYYELVVVAFIVSVSRCMFCSSCWAVNYSRPTELQ